MSRIKATAPLSEEPSLSLPRVRAEEEHPLAGLHREVSGIDQKLFLDLCVAAQGVCSMESFDRWCTTEVRAFFPYGKLLCASGRIFGEMVVVDSLHGVDFPVELLECNRRRTTLADRWIVRKWLATRSAQFIEHRDVQSELSPLEIREFRRLDLGNIAAHGVIEPDNARASYFSFSQLPTPLDQETRLKFELITPSLHQALSMVIWAKLQEGGGLHPLTKLTAKELEVLRWILAGKTNAEIALILERSIKTVKNQVASILRKLDVSTRAQAAVRATEMGIAWVR